MKKMTITKNQIMKVYALTIDTQPFYSTMGYSHSERMIKWFEREGYNITAKSISGINNYIQQRKEIMEQVLFTLNNDR